MISYRGSDLELSAAAERLAAALPNERPRRLWVDETVLACCNHAYDLAVAHRARSVRLEHLLHAMTLIDAAVAGLEARGVRVASLRRESASLIASEPPGIEPEGRIQPRTSDALEDVLRQAVERASSRRAPATIDDILNVLVDMKRDLPGSGLLRNHSQNWNLRDTAEPQRPVGGEQREWVRVQARSAPYYAPEPPRPGSTAIPPAATLTDSMQNSRLDAVERAMRDLGQGVDAERVTVSQLLSDLRREIIAERDEHSRFRNGLADRLGTLEQAVLTVRNDGNGASSAERLGVIERSVDAKFSELARTWAILGERLTSLEAAVVEGDTATGPAPAMEAVDRRLGDMERLMQAVADRIGAMERAAMARPAATAELAPVVERLGALERLIASRPANPINMTAVSERLTAVDGRLTESGDRLARIEKLLDTAPGGDGSTAGGDLAERLRLLDQSVTAQRTQLNQLATTIGADVRTLVANVAQGSAASERQQSQLAAAVSAPLADRLGTVERLLTTYRQELDAATAGHLRDLKEVHEALVKLNANQQTLATSMDQWRLDLINDIGEVANQVADLERSTARPAELLETVAGRLQTLQVAQARREEHKSRFRQWLLGTDDWYGASWGHNGSRAPQPGSSSIQVDR